MKEGGKENRCETHSLPLLKIDLQTHRLLCEKCLSESDEDRRQRLEMLRLKLTRNYQLELNELKVIKEQTDRLLELFQSKNMTEAKKLINKASSEAQKIIETLLDKEIKEANKTLKEAAESELEKWKSIDGRNFSQSYLLFEEEQPQIDQRLLQLKQSLKSQIAAKLKQEMRNYYSSIFEF